MGRFLIVLGVVLIAVGFLINLGVPIGRLPGDITIRRDNFSFYFPVTTSIIASIVLTLLMYFLSKR
jgi:formate hydrogenlyase subunit 3/multisubunit Na+/H+ antiporter MnhD subunit